MVWRSGRLSGDMPSIKVDDRLLHDSHSSTEFTSLGKGDYDFDQQREKYVNTGRPLSVTFDDSYEEFEVLSRTDYTNLETMLCWYTTAEIDRIWDSKAKIAARMERGERCTRAMTYRGLECQTIEGERELGKNVSRVVTAIMDEQDRQWAMGYDDFNAFAQLSLSISAECVRKALYRAVMVNMSEGDWDAEDDCLPRKGIHCVTFDESFNGIEMFDKCTETDKQRYWYSEKELCHIVRANQKVLDRTKHGERPMRSTTLRGLEHLSEEGGKALGDNVARVIAAVMDEQDRQWAADQDDPYAFMQVSMSASKACVKRALKIAEEDEKEANKPEKELVRHRGSGSQVSRTPSSEMEFSEMEFIDSDSEASISTVESKKISQHSSFSRPPLPSRRSASSRSTCNQEKPAKSSETETDSVSCNSSGESDHSTGVNSSFSRPPLPSRRSASSRSTCNQEKPAKSSETETDSVSCNSSGESDHSTGVHAVFSRQSASTKVGQKRTSLNILGNNKVDPKLHPNRRSSMDHTIVKKNSKRRPSMDMAGKQTQKNSKRRSSMGMNGSKESMKPNANRRTSMDMVGNKTNKNSNRRLSMSMHGTKKESSSSNKLSTSMHGNKTEKRSNSSKSLSMSMQGNKKDKSSNSKRRSSMGMVGNQTANTPNRRLSMSRQGSMKEKNRDRRFSMSSAANSNGRSLSMHEKIKLKHSNSTSSAKAVLPRRSDSNTVVSGNRSSNKGVQKIDPSQKCPLPRRRASNAAGGKGLSVSMHGTTYDIPSKPSRRSSVSPKIPLPRRSSSTVVSSGKKPGPSFGESEDEEGTSLAAARRIILRRRASTSTASNADIPQRSRSFRKGGAPPRRTSLNMIPSGCTMPANKKNF